MLHKIPVNVDQNLCSFFIDTLNGINPYQNTFTKNSFKVSERKIRNKNMFNLLSDLKITLNKYTSKFGTCSLHFLSKTDIWSLWIKKKNIVWNKPSHGISKNWVSHYSLMKSSFDINDLLYYTLMRDGHRIARCPIWLYTM